MSSFNNQRKFSEPHLNPSSSSSSNAKRNGFESIQMQMRRANSVGGTPRNARGGGDVTMSNLTRVLQGRGRAVPQVLPPSAVSFQHTMTHRQRNNAVVERKVSIASVNGDAFIPLGEAAREGDEKAVGDFVDNNGPSAVNVRFAVEVAVRKDRNRENKGREEESGKHISADPDEEERKFIKNEYHLHQTATLEVTALHLAIIARQANVVRVLLNRATCFGMVRLRKMLEAKVKLKFLQDPRTYQKSDQTLHEANAFHVAVLFHTASLRLLLKAVTQTERSTLELRHLVDAKSGAQFQSPLHAAAKSGRGKCARMLLAAGAAVDAREVRGFTPLHLASKAGCTENTIYQVASMLLENCADPDAEGMGHYRKTPLHRARKPGMVRLLLDFGANPYAAMAFKEGDGGWYRDDVDGRRGTDEREAVKSALDVLMKRNPKAAAEILNQGLSTNAQDLDSSDLLLVLDLEVFHREAEMSGPRCNNEAAAHARMLAYEGAKDLLKHPLSEAFMHMKWNMVKTVFYFNVFIYTAYVLFLTTLAVTATSIVKDHAEVLVERNETLPEYDEIGIRDCLAETEEDHGVKHNTFWTFLVLTLNGVIILTIREISQAYANWRTYIRSFENILEVSIITLTVAYVIVLFNNIKLAAHLGSIAVFMTWIDLTLLLGRFPTIGIYIYMSFHVMKLLLVILSVYLTTLLAFSFAFYLLLPTHGAFDHPISSFLKVVVMMIGEYDYEDNFMWDQVKDRGSNGTVQALFIFFVFLITITISNLIVGLTVSKTEVLFREAGIIRLKKTVIQVMGIEDILMRSPSVVDFLPKKVKSSFFHNTQLFSYLHFVATNFETFKVCVRPADMKTLSRAKVDGESSGDDILIGINQPGRLVPVYLYDEEKGCRGRKLRFRIPTWIVRKIFRFLEEKEDPVLDWDLSSDEDDDDDDDSNDTTNTTMDATLRGGGARYNNTADIAGPSPMLRHRRKPNNANHMSTSTLKEDDIRNSKIVEARKASTDDEGGNNNDDDDIEVDLPRDPEAMSQKITELEGVAGDIRGHLRELKKLKRLSLVLAGEGGEGELSEVNEEEEEEEEMDERTKFFKS